MAEGILRQSYDSSGKKIYPLTVIDGILRTVDVNVMDGQSRGAYAIIDSMKNHDVDFAKAYLTTLDVTARTWDESTHSYYDSSRILFVNKDGFKVDSGKTSTFTGVIRALNSVNVKEVKSGVFNEDGIGFTTTGLLRTNDELAGKIELFKNNTTFFTVDSGQLSWKSPQSGNGLKVDGTQLTYSGGSVVIGNNVSVGNDVSVGGKINIKKDASVDGSLYVGGGITFNGPLYANKDACIHNRLHVFDPGYTGYDLLDVSKNGTKIATDTTITKNLTVEGVITATDVSAHNLVNGSSELNLAGNLNNNSLYFNYRAGSNIDQIYMCAGNGTQTSNGNLTKVIAKSLQIGGNNTSYTDSSLLLWTDGEGGHPSIEFKRGVSNDGYTDWRIVSDNNDNNILKIQYKDDSTNNVYKDSICFDKGKLYLYGTVSGNRSRYISSDASTNVCVTIEGETPLVIEKNSVHRGDSSQYIVDLGNSKYPWRNGYFDNIFSDSITTQGTKTYMTTTNGHGWYKIGATDASTVNNPSSNTNIFIVNRSTGNKTNGTEGYIVSFVNDYYNNNGNWSDSSSSVHVQITQISGNYGLHHLITKFATICNNKNETEYYMYYAGSSEQTAEVYVSCIGTASPIKPLKTTMKDASMATGSIFYTDRGAGIRGDFYVNGKYNQRVDQRKYVKISEDTISAYTTNRDLSTSVSPTILSTGDSSVSIKKHLTVGEGIDVQKGDISLGNHLIFKNTATFGNSVNLIKVEEKKGTNRHLDIRTDGLYLSKGEYGQESTTGKVSLNVDGSIYTIGGGGLTISGFSTFNNGLKINNGLESNRSIISSAKLSLEWRTINADSCDKYNIETYGPAGDDPDNVNIWVLKENEKVYQVLHFDENSITGYNALAIPSTYPAWTTVMVIFKDKSIQNFNFIKKVDANKILRVNKDDMGLPGGAIYFICLGSNTYNIGLRECREIHAVYRYGISIF